jgi:hypothetical protein
MAKEVLLLRPVRAFTKLKNAKTKKEVIDSVEASPGARSGSAKGLSGPPRRHLRQCNVVCPNLMACSTPGRLATMGFRADQFTGSCSDAVP